VTYRGNARDIYYDSSGRNPKLGRDPKLGTGADASSRHSFILSIRIFICYLHLSYYILVAECILLSTVLLYKLFYASFAKVL
jgi:hypothetical protein